jgi:hypothetical protein
MGRNKKVKTLEEQEQYKEKRRIQNRINQRNFRKRKKLIENLTPTLTQFQKELKYKDELSNELNKIGFDFFITLTTKNKLSIKLLNNSIKELKEKIRSIEKIFYVIETGKTNHPHLHLLVKTTMDKNQVIKSIRDTWNRGFIDVKTIYSGEGDLTLQEYLMKEVRIYNKDPERWWLF